ncbi:MAG: dethiobiotin synthase [Sulfuricurvum sp.]|nr:dethiobiotin synthase [Sulfuricurvum sp.]
MSKRIFITATNTNVGKTYTTIKLMEAYTKMGLRVGVYKPIETGVNGLPADGILLLKHAQSLNQQLKKLHVNDIVTLALPLPAAPYVANKGKKIDLTLFDRALEKIEALCDIVLIEGAGGIMVPLDETLMLIDLPRHFNAITLLVTHCQLGCINDTLLSLNVLMNTNLPHLWVSNCRAKDDTFVQISLPYFKKRYDHLYFIGHDNTALAQALLDKINQENSQGV